MTKRVKSVMAIALVIATLFSVSALAAAPSIDDAKLIEEVQQETVTIEEAPLSEDFEVEQNHGLVLVNPYLRGNSKPSNSVNPPMYFGGTVSAARGGDLYTDNYFTNFKNGSIHMQVSNYNSQYLNSVVGIIYKEAFGVNKQISSFSVMPGNRVSVNCTNFDPSAKYYIYFYSMGPFSFSGSVQNG